MSFSCLPSLRRKTNEWHPESSVGRFCEHPSLPGALARGGVTGGHLEQLMVQLCLESSLLQGGHERVNQACPLPLVAGSDVVSHPCCQAGMASAGFYYVPRLQNEFQG